MEKKVSVVLPCKNEEQALKTCITKIRIVFKENNINGEIILVDNNSIDDSKKIGISLGVRVVVQEIDGYGNAYIKGLENVLGDFIVIGDVDNTYNFLEIPRFISALNEGNDFVIGSRFRGNIERGSMKLLHRYLGIPILNSMFNFLFRTNLSDIFCGFRAFNKNYFNRAKLNTGKMEFAMEMIVRAVELNLKIKEIPITYSKRIGKSKLRSFRDGFRYLIFMIKERFL